MTPEQLLFYAVPPLVGAFIGYLTNTIAIRMLFRPLRPWRLLGMRLPLTPGVIPSKREELARNIGDMVGSHLLTSADVGRALERESFRRELRQAVGEKLSRFLDRELGSFESLIPEEFRGRFRDLVMLLNWKLTLALFNYLESAEFEGLVRGKLREKTDELLVRDLESFLTPERYQAVRAHLEERIGTFLRSEDFGRSVAAFVDSKFEELLTSQKPLREILPADLVEVLLSVIEKEIPPMLEKLGGLLYDPDFRARLVRRAKQAIEEFLDNLQGLAGLMSGFINMEKIHAKLPEFLDHAGDEISRWLREEKTQAQVAGMLRDRVDGLLNQTPASFVEKLPYEKVAGVRRYLRGKTVEFMRSPRATGLTLATLERGVQRIKDRNFNSLLNRVLPEGGIDNLREAAATQILAGVRSPATRRFLSEKLQGRVDDFLLNRPVGKLSAKIPADVQEELESGICRQLEELLKKEVPPLVATLNVQQIVEDKVNSLDILKVEGLLLGIMKEQFKYINLFGALLGFVIGLVNLLLLGLR